MRKRMGYNPRKRGRERSDEAAGGYDAARKAEDDALGELIRKNIEEHGA